MSCSAWRLLTDPPGPGAWNMAVDEVLARAVGDRRAPPTLRLYQWVRPHVSLGLLQPAAGAVDLAACRRLGFPVIRRPTGGRALLHAQELTYSAAVPREGAWRDLSVEAGFRLLCEGVMAGLRRLGLPAELGGSPGRRPAGRPAACFLARGIPAILVRGRKLVGSAQRRYERSLLQHGALLLDFDPGMHRAVFPGWPPETPVAGITSVRELLGESPPIRELWAALAAGWSDVFRAPCTPGKLGPEELAEAERLARTCYGQDTWTFRR